MIPENMPGSDPRKRVGEAVRHGEPDRVPVDFGSTAVTGMHVSCVAALRDYFGLEKRPVKVHEPYQMLGLIDEDLKQALQLDVDGIFPPKTMFGFRNRDWKTWRMPDGLEVLVSDEFRVTQAENGDFLIYPEGDTTAPPSGRMPGNGYFFDTIIRQEAIDEERLDPEDNLEEFGPVREQDIAELKSSVEQCRTSGRAIMLSFSGTALGDIALVPAPFMKRPRGIRDVTEWYISTRVRRDYIHRIFSRQSEIALGNLERVHEAIGSAVDVVFLCGTDFGTQSSTFCSTETFRELYLPYYRKLNDWIHRHTTWKTFKHSCGSVDRFIPSFIEAGFDILNPVQCSAAGMDPGRLKEDFGDRLVFWGGGVDTQRVLPFGTPEEVRRQVVERCRILSRNGGFVFNAIHNIQARTPVENIAAMFEGVREFNGSS